MQLYYILTPSCPEISTWDTIAWHDINFCGDLTSRAIEIQLPLALLQLSRALENCMFYNVSFETKWNMVLTCESIFSRTSLYAYIAQNLIYSNKNIQHTCPVGQARYSFHLPFSSNLQIHLARGNGASTNVEPCTENNLINI